MRNVDVLDRVPWKLPIRRDQQTLFYNFPVGFKFVAWVLKGTDSCFLVFPEPVDYGTGLGTLH